MQSVKALILNSAQRIKIEGLDVLEDLILKIKKRHSLELLCKSFTNLEDLNNEEKRKLSHSE